MAPDAPEPRRKAEDVDAILRLCAGDDAPRGRIELADSRSPLEFQGWLELIAAIERLRQQPRQGEKDT